MSVENDIIHRNDAQNIEVINASVPAWERPMIQFVLNHPELGAPIHVTDAGDGFIVETDAGEIVENNIAHVGLTIVR
ncbi:hypothetical protein [Halorubrum ezzemoulense]|uniref:hypothetical protein n=1 Tax=Halorubrum ezzemoulense TaxID=337243 RepID=UPI00232BBFB5|nr:hypothetical protein [Halorubrum ezzemoulense]MDB9251869.1 hypothetical protein [Halorubrum ezzemoulense]MDB9256278.1 hypothetical protein [Halorubrum ezzemoulense]MDB9276989.1 hypothetical protein [Halorubrum ezzemoulense]